MRYEVSVILIIEAETPKEANATAHKILGNAADEGLLEDWSFDVAEDAK